MRVDEFVTSSMGIACRERLDSPFVDDVIHDVHRLSNSLVRVTGLDWTRSPIWPAVLVREP
jgi:hypothetical protein